MSDITTPPLTRSRTGNVVRASLGNLIEYYDWFIYASFSIYFAPVFFPEGNPTAQLLSAAVVFALGFLCRPLGGWVLGLYADRFGRRNALTVSVLLMGLGSLVIGVTPSFETIGWAAPILLVLSRILQGLSIGGEFGSSATYLSEMAPPGRRGLFSSFVYVSIVIGQLSALSILVVCQMVFTAEELSSWAWRIPFFLGTVASLVVLYLRRQMDESTQFEQQRRAEARASADGQVIKKGLRALLTEYPRQVFVVCALAVGGSVAYYTYTTYMQKYLVNSAGMSRTEASWILFGALVLFLFMQPVAGLLSDRFGRRAVLGVFSVCGIVLTVPLMTAIGNAKNPFVALLLVCVPMVYLSGYSALTAIVKAEMFPTKVRAIGVALPHAIVVSLFGGTSESVALALKQAGSEATYFWYVSACCLAGGIAILFVREPSKNSTFDDNRHSDQDAVDRSGAADHDEPRRSSTS